jgi:hypothetical protein
MGCRGPDFPLSHIEDAAKLCADEAVVRLHDAHTDLALSNARRS